MNAKPSGIAFTTQLVSTLQSSVFIVNVTSCSTSSKITHIETACDGKTHACTTFGKAFTDSLHMIVINESTARISRVKYCATEAP